MTNTDKNAGMPSTMTRRGFLVLGGIGIAGFALGCATDPVTGEKEFMLVSRSQEIAMDRQHSPHQFSADYGEVQDRQLNNYIRQVGNSMAARTHRPDMPYSFRVVNATYVNAYAFPGGSIAATRGIMLKMDNEDELASLLGHELGHVNARHTAEQMSKSQVASLAVAGLSAYLGTTKYKNYADIAGQLGMVGAGALLASYSRDNEREADRLGNQYMVQSGYNTKGFVGLMEMLNTLSNHKSSAVELLFATHPMSKDRLEAAQQRAGAAYSSSRSKRIQRERYMDNIAGLRKISGAIESMQKGDAALMQKKYPEAEALYRKALNDAPNDYTGLLSMAKAKIMQEQFNDAISYANTARKVYPSEAQACHIEGFASIRAGRFQNAVSLFNQYQKLLPGNPNTIFFKGYAYEGMGNRNQAAAQYREYLSVTTQGPEAQHAYKKLVEWGYVKSGG